MTAYHDTGQKWLDDWCTSIGVLTKDHEGYWSRQDTGDVSYPAGGHASFAEVEPFSYWFNHRNEVIGSVVARFPPAGPIADVGGGNGYVSLHLRRSGHECFVIEPGIVGASCSHERGVPVIQAPFQDLPIPDESLPAVALFDVLEHIEDDGAALRRISRALKPDGKLYLTVPAFQSLWSSEDIYAGHYRRYQMSLLTRRLRESGFSIDYASYFFNALAAPVFLFRTIPSRLNFRNATSPAAAASDHALPSGIAGSILTRALAREARKIATGYTIAFGSSCIVAATRL